MLLDYLGQMGIPTLGDDLFTDGPGCLIIRPLPAGAHTFTRAEVERGLPWRK